MNKITIILGVVIVAIASWTLASAVAVLARPAFTITTSMGDLSADFFFYTDIYSGWTLIIVGIAIIYIGIKGKD